MTRSPVHATTIRAWSERRIVAMFLLAGMAVAPLLAVAPLASAALSGGALVLMLSARHPRVAVAAFVGLLPFLVGVARGGVVPGLRLNEALLLAVLGGVALGLSIQWWQGQWRLPVSFHPLDLAVLAVACTSSITPLLWMYARQKPIGIDDVLYAVALWKLAALYALVRVTIRTSGGTQNVLKIVLCSSAVVAVIGMLQAVGTGPVIQLLARWVPLDEDAYDISINRATATLGHPIAYGDLMIYAAVIGAALAMAFRVHQRAYWSLTAVVCLGALASGQASAVLGLAVAGLVFGRITGTARHVAVAGVGLGITAAVALEPVVMARVRSLESGSGLPTSWVGDYGRLENLKRHVWPEIAADANWLLGVRPSSRVPAPEAWREWVYIESGYTWAVWNGGLPLLGFVLLLLVVGIRTGVRLSRAAEASSSALGTALITILSVLAALLVLDPHLTLRGAGDLVFVLLALAATRDAALHAARGVPQPAERSTT